MDLEFPGYGSSTAIWSLLLAALVGFLIGLERERKREISGSIFAGIRTFPLIAVFGSVSGLIYQEAGSAVLVTGFIAATVMAALAYWRESSGAKIGGTTGFAVLVSFALGVLTSIDLVGAALAGAVLVTGLLSMRQELRDLSNTVTQQDLFAVVQFAAVSLIVLPLVPDESFGPWGALNPRTIWIQVVLISGISFVGYLAMKLAGNRRGTVLSGVLGGLASSTAVMLSLSRRSKDVPELSGLLAVGALAGAGTSIIRMAVIIAAVQSELLLHMAFPLLVLLGVPLLAALIFGARQRHGDVEGVTVKNPFELRTALEFGVVYAVILLVTRGAQEAFGDAGVYVASFLGGLVRPDAVALSLAGSTYGVLEANVVVVALTLALATNTVFKAGLAFSLGSRRFAWPVALTLLLTAVLALAAAWLAPPLTELMTA